MVGNGMELETTRLIYEARQEQAVHYIDLFRGLALVNGKNVDSFENRKPLVVVGSIRMNTSTEEVEAIKPTWAVRGAINKSVAAWDRTLKSAGLTRKQLNTYGKEIRYAWDKDHSDNFCAWNAATKIVDAIPAGVELKYKSKQYNQQGLEYIVNAQLPLDAGLGVQFGPSPAASPAEYNVRAFDNTKAAVPASGSTDVSDKYFTVFGEVGASATHLPILDTYLDSRVNTAEVEDTDMDNTPDSDNDFIMMLAPGEEVADDVIDNVREEGRWMPYTTASSLNSTDIIVPGANVAGQDTGFVAPLGLLKWKPTSTSSRLVIEIMGAVEMQ